MDLVTAALHALNILLVIGLLAIYVRNYAAMKSKYTIGLVIFALLFLVQGVMSLYFDASMIMYSDKYAENIATGLEAVKTVGLAVLLWISWE